jgi:putative heme transporter
MPPSASSDAWPPRRPRVALVSDEADERPVSSTDRSSERLTERLAHQWAARRAERKPEVVIAAGRSNYSRAEVPWGLDLAAAWAWRLIVIGIATYALLRGIEFFAELTIPVIIALLISALGSPAVSAMERVGVRRGIGAAIVVLGGLALVATMLAFAGQQVVSGANDLATQVSDGLGEIKNWLNTGPFHLSDKQINDYIQKAQDSLAKKAKEGAFISQVTNLGSVLTHMLAGLFLVLFSTYFFLADGDRIWAWFVRLAPRTARARVDSSGRVAWISLTQFVRATVIVAITDATGVMIAAKVLDVQFVLAIGVLVFLGAFVPIVGAFVAGTVAVLVALVDHGIVVALIMLGAVVLVQQIESHVLQPFLMGRFVSVHPLGVIVAIAGGILVAGIPGALVAVPFAAAANAVVQHLASETQVGEEDPEVALEDDYEDTGQEVEPDALGDPLDDQDDGRVGDVDQAGVADRFDENGPEAGGAHD